MKGKRDTSRERRERSRSGEACRCGAARQSACGVAHGDCPNAWKGSCDLAPGHGGSHHCGACNMVF